MIKKDTRVLDSLMKDIYKLVESESEVGFYGDHKHPNSGDSLAEIAYINNYGGPNPDPTKAPIPARPFMTYAIENAEVTLGKKMVEGLSDLISGIGNIKTTLDKPASELQKWIGWTIEMDELYTPNAAMTISKKGGSSEPLTETGYLAENVERRVHIGKRRK